VDQWQELLEACADVLSDSEHEQGVRRLTGTKNVVGSLERLHNAVEAIDPTVPSV
jgi:hypothetical protein